MFNCISAATLPLATTLDRRPRMPETCQALNVDLSYFLELRLGLRGNPEATAIVDRCLALIARAETADDAAFADINREVAKVADDLALRFGAPRTALLQ